MVFNYANLEESPRPKHGHRWGHWRYDAHRSTLDLKGKLYANGSPIVYWIKLENYADDSSAFDLVSRISLKSWASASDVGFLVEALTKLKLSSQREQRQRSRDNRSQYDDPQQR